jgi:hypothetical protein
LCIYFSLFGAERAAIAYDFSGGRFGDNLLTYLHGLWIAYTYDIDLVYKPFEFSDQLLLHNMSLDKNHPFKKHILCDGDVDTLLRVSNLSKPTLFTVHYFPELSWGGELEKEIPIYHRKMDINSDEKAHILYIYYPYPHPNPQSLAALFAEALIGLDIQIGYREAANSEKENILEDFFALTKFDGAIHGDSNFAICAGFISDYAIEIRPMSSERLTGFPNIDRICMRVKHTPRDIEYIYTSVSLSPL